MEAGNTKKPRITTLDDLFGIPSSPIPNAAEVQIQEIELSKLHEFEGHPFKVLEDPALLDMAKSIQEIGQLTPAIVRPLENRPGEYELVSGNRRHRACLLAGLTHMRVIVKEMTRDEAIIQMVDANLQREHILPSERAMAYKMKLEAIKRQGMRTDLTCVENQHKLEGKKSRDIVAEQAGESADKVRAYIRLTELIPTLLNLVDEKKIALRPAVELSYLSEQQQYDLCETMELYDCTPSLSQAQRLKEAARAGKLDKNGMELVMQEEKPNQKEVVKLSRERLNKYFPPDMPPQKIEETIVKALDLYYKRLERHRQEQEYTR